MPYKGTKHTPCLLPFQCLEPITFAQLASKAAQNWSCYLAVTGLATEMNIHQ